MGRRLGGWPRCWPSCLRWGSGSRGRSERVTARGWWTGGPPAGGSRAVMTCPAAGLRSSRWRTGSTVLSQISHGLGSSIGGLIPGASGTGWRGEKQAGPRRAAPSIRCSNGCTGTSTLSDCPARSSTVICGNVLFAEGLPPAVIDFSPYYRPAGFATAIVIVDAIAWSGASPDLAEHAGDVELLDQLVARAAIYRLVTADVVSASQTTDWVLRQAEAHRPILELIGA